ncbi:hypothetical protein TIFTF001_012505 [Ficus carica]|uniref:Uncharacterized protein n=1 Tax=Ficus carica TaxID=3494 RepID=A0AA88AG17_FICCA|nr:hypothetical protein TIFTF001_012505 [Ficus carica]
MYGVKLKVAVMELPNLAVTAACVQGEAGRRHHGAPELGPRHLRVCLVLR